MKNEYIIKEIGKDMYFAFRIFSNVWSSARPCLKDKATRLSLDVANSIAKCDPSGHKWEVERVLD